MKSSSIQFFIEPDNGFSNGVICLNLERGVISAEEQKVLYKKTPIPVWEVDLRSLQLLRKNRVSIPGFKFKTYANINGRIQAWQLLDFRKKSRAAKVRKAIEKMAQKKMAEKRRPPLA